jgi:iron complex outermembrane recepter protein
MRMATHQLVALASASWLAIAAASPVAAQAQETERDDPAFNNEDDEAIVVQGTRSRLGSALESVPGSITVLDAAAIDDQSKFSNDLGEILQRTVPGFGVSSSASYSNFSQTLRGRKPAVFIDGVPTTTPLRDGGRDLRLISPEAIGRIEVIRGATSLYGLGGAGGLINYATKEPTEEGFNGTTDVSAGFSLTNPSDSFNGSIDQSFYGRTGPVAFILSGYYETFDSLFDARGERLPPNPQGQGGIAESEAYNLFGKAILHLDTQQRISLSGNYYSFEQDASYSPVPGSGVFGVRAPDVREVAPLGDTEFTKNWITMARYDHDDLLGSRVTLQGYYGKYSARFGFFSFPFYPPNGGQTLIDAKRWGIRADAETQIGGGVALWGVDYTSDTTSQPLERPGFPVALLVPEMKQKSVAPFLQLSYPIGDVLDIRGGVRWENSDVTVDTFTTEPLFFPSLIGGVTVQGGKLSYSKLLFNAGVTLSPFGAGALEPVSFFAAFSQGFSVGDLGRALRTTTAPSIEAFGFEAQIIDSYEVGVRYSGDVVRASLAGFLSKSEFGSTFNANDLTLVRAPEEVWGLEATLDVQASDAVVFGGNFSWVDGNRENVTTGAISPLDTSRIGPTKLVIYSDYDFAEGWGARLQVTSSGRQNRFPGNPRVFGQADIEAYTLVDLSITGEVGPGELTLAVNNLLNEYYFTPDAYRFATPDQFTPGQGATARISYRIEY